MVCHPYFILHEFLKHTNHSNFVPEQSKVASPDSLSQLIVSLQRLAQAWLCEVLVLRNLTQQQPHQDEPLADCHSEAQSAVGRLCKQGVAEI